MPQRIDEDRLMVCGHRLPWSAQNDAGLVLDADGGTVARFAADTDAPLWRAIVDAINQRMPVSDGAYGVTVAQARCLALIEDGICSNGFSPSYQELADLMGVHSKGRIHEHVVALSERGRVWFLPNRSRSISVLVPLTSQERHSCNPSPKP